MKNYQRIAVAGMLSLFINVVMFHFLIPVSKSPSYAIVQNPEPLVLNIQPEEDKEVPQFVEPLQSSEVAPEIRDRIAEFDAKALDELLKLGEVEGPTVEEEAPLDSLPALETPLSTSKPQEEKVAPPAPSQPAMPLPIKEEHETPLQIAARNVPLPPSIQAPPQEQIKPATPAPIPNPETPSYPQPSRGRLNNSIKDKGFMNYAALEDKLAPYLKEIQEKVRREWYTLLLTRYSGTKPRVAEIEIAISADGSLRVCTVINNNDDPIFAALCKEAIRRAAPFTPFNFDIPDIYRNKNLEIYWTFNFL